jgi:GntR family transcriptional repressor for pyruvate dehydrogenase complex
MLKTVEARLVADEVATQILGLMTRGVLQPNDKLPTEVALAQSLGVGRSTVREAKGQLAAKGFLTTRGKSGTYVSTPSANPLDVEAVVALVSDASAEQLHEARSIVEIAAIQLAAKRFEAKDIDELRQATHPVDGEVWFNHVDVHRAIVAASHNTILLALYDLLSHPIRVKLSAFYEAVADPRAELSAHSNLVEAIQSGDPGTAANAMSEHLHGSDIKRHDALNAFLQSRGS